MDQCHFDNVLVIWFVNEKEFVERYLLQDLKRTICDWIRVREYYTKTQRHTLTLYEVSGIELNKSDRVRGNTCTLLPWRGDTAPGLGLWHDVISPRQERQRRGFLGI